MRSCVACSTTTTTTSTRWQRSARKPSSMSVAASTPAGGNCMLADILSITAIVISFISLGWQVVTWYQSGAVVEVTAFQALLTSGPEADWHLDVTARNK